MSPNYAFLSFFAPKTCICLFAAKLGCSGLYLTKSNVFPFLSLNYAVFSLIITITNSSILIGAFAT